MRAAVLVRHGAPETAFEIREVPTVEPGAGQVRVKVEAFGLNFADVMARLGIYQDAPPLPSILGYECAGVIDAVGDGVDAARIGQRVVAFTRFGAYAEYVVTDAGAAAAIGDMPATEAVAIPTQLGTAVFCAEERVRLHAGDHVLVQAAAGGVGLALVQIAKAAGCVVYGTASKPEKLEHLASLGVDHCINYREHDFAEVVRGHVGERGLDVVFDSIGGASVKKGVELLGSGGRMVCFGAASHAGERKSLFRTVKMAASFGIHHPIKLMMTSKSVIGVNLLRIADDRPEQIQRCLERSIELVEDGTVSIHVGGVWPVEELGAAHAALGGRSTIGKVAVTFDSPSARSV